MRVCIAVEGRSDVGMSKSVVRAAGLQPARVVVANGKTRLDPKISGYMKAAAFEPWVVFRDSDGLCPVDLRARLTSGGSEPKTFALRVACTMTEAWLLGDVEGFARHFAVPGGCATP